MYSLLRQPDAYSSVHFPMIFEWQLELHVPQPHRDYAESFYRQHGVTDDTQLLGLVPSASEPTRCWPASRFAALADTLNKSHGLVPVCFGSHTDQAIIDQVTSSAKTKILVEDFNRGNILDSAALIARCRVVVGNVSGPLHIADALGVPVVGIYGPHPPGRFGLLGARTRTVNMKLDCIPCNNPECVDRRCINDITVDMVNQAVLDLLK